MLAAHPATHLLVDGGLHERAVVYRFINPPIALYELMIGFWLLFKGVNVQSWADPESTS